MGVRQRGARVGVRRRAGHAAEVGACGDDGDAGGYLGGQPADGPRCAAQSASRVAEGGGMGTDAASGADDEGGVDLTDALIPYP